MEKNQYDLCLEILRRFHNTGILDEDKTKTDKELNSIMKKIGYKGYPD